MKTMGEPLLPTRCPDGMEGCTHYGSDANEFIDMWRADRDATAKRFTATELAAKYWRAKAGPRIRAYQRDESGNIIDVPGIGWEYEHQVLLRFVTLPSYDEVAS